MTSFGPVSASDIAPPKRSIFAENRAANNYLRGSPMARRSMSPQLNAKKTVCCVLSFVKFFLPRSKRQWRLLPSICSPPDLARPTLPGACLSGRIHRGCGPFCFPLSFSCSRLSDSCNLRTSSRRNPPMRWKSPAPPKSPSMTKLQSRTIIMRKTAWLLSKWPSRDK